MVNTLVDLVCAALLYRGGLLQSAQSMSSFQHQCPDLYRAGLNKLLIDWFADPASDAVFKERIAELLKVRRHACNMC